MSVIVHHGDSRDVLATLAAGSIDACVTDPPYGLAFMNKRWDRGDTCAFDPDFWRLVLRALKPGGHVLAFGGTRTYHRLVCAIEDAGFEVRDQLAWIYGAGFPKSHDVSKAMDRTNGNPLAWRAFADAYESAVAASGLSHADIDRHLGIRSSSCYWVRTDHRGGLPPRHHWGAVRVLLGLPQKLERLYEAAEREVIGTRMAGIANPDDGARHTIGASKAVEIDVTAPATDAARQWAGWGTALKPALEPICLARKPLVGTVAANVAAHGTGALNIDGCRIEADWANDASARGFGHGYNNAGYSKAGAVDNAPVVSAAWEPTKGRWPANVIHDGSAEATAGFPDSRSAGQYPSASAVRKGVTDFSGMQGALYDDSGSASRYFYSAKADAGDRLGSKHPTVKPVDLIAYLCRLITPPGGTVLDPFAGSGTTGMACLREGFDAVLIEREAEYVADIRRRVAHVSGQDAPLFSGAAE